MLPSLNNSAEALTSTSGAVLAGNGAELWLGNNFNFEVLEDISDKLFGDEDPVAYVKKRKDTQTDSYVVTASTINSKVGNATNGLVVKLDGKEWMVASLTLDNSENVVLTLYLANSLGTSKFYTADANTKGNNMYSRSTIRNHLLTDSTWSLFRDSSFTKYLVQPKNIKYQLTESQVGRANPIGGDYQMPNESLLAQTSNWSTAKYAPADTYGGYRYDAWGDDYIWIPSVTETGSTNYLQTSCIWQLSNAQRTHSQSYLWLRSGYSGHYGGARTLQSSGASDGNTLAKPYGVRPAVHLNLTAAGGTWASTLIENPNDLTTTYNGTVHTVKELYTAKPTDVAWYDKDIYEHTPEQYVTITPEKELKNAGTYWVKVEITQDWVNAINTKTEADGTRYDWSAEQVDAAKEARSPKFKGIADTSDSSHLESDTVRWFKFKIKPAELEIPTAAEPSKTYTGSDIEFAISGYDSAKMSAVPPEGYTLSNDGKISFKNANTYPIKISIKDNNYCWKGTSDDEAPDRSAKTINITVTQKGIIINFTSSSDKFSMAVGENVTFTAVASAADVAAGDTVTPTITYYKGSDNTNITSATGAEFNASGLATGTYTLGAKLENKDGTANGNYKITSVTPKTVTVGSKTITIENVTWQYEQDDEYTEISGDSVVLTYNGKEFKFSVKETTEELRAKGVKIDTSYGSNGYTNGVQINATDGTVTVTVKLVPYDDSFEFESNGAEKVTEKVFSLTVTINKIELKLSDFVWSAEPTNELEYTGNTQTVTIVKGLPSFLQVVYHGNSGLVVGPYTTTILSITVKNDAESVEMAKNYTSFEPEDYADYEYKWQITKKKIVANWTNEEHTTTNGKKVSIPKVSGVDEGILEYSYTKYPSGEAVTLAEILASYSETEICVYNVTVKIAENKTDSYMLLNSKNEVKDEVTQNFAVGDNKKSVTVSLQETKVYFNNQPQAVKLSYTGEGITMGDFAVEYKLVNADGSEGEATNIAPTAVGKYKVTITLTGEKANTHIIVGENVFEYIIAHKDRFILTEAAAASHPYKFLYEDFHEYEQDIKEYLYNAENAESIVYIAHLAFEDTLADLLKQFANAEDITAWGADGTVIEDLTTLLATGMMLRMMDGDTVLNQLTISVMGDIDGDGDIGTADKARLNSYTLGNLELKGAYLLSCDLDSDGEVGTADKARLNAYTLGNLDIYTGLTLRATAQATSEAVSACDEPAVVDESEPAFVTSVVMETTPLATTVQATCADESESGYETSAVIECADDCKSVDDCENASEIDMAGYATSLPSNETAAVYTAIAEAIQTFKLVMSLHSGSLCRFAPRNDGAYMPDRFGNECLAMTNFIKVHDEF